MSEKKYTPGPWYPIHNGHFWECRTENKRYLGVCPAYAWGAQTAKEDEANARLIASAPELVEALEECVAKLELAARELGNDQEMIDIALMPYRLVLRRALGTGGEV